MSYEYLIAGFEDIALNERVQTSEEQLLTLLDEHLSASDKELLALLRRKNDDPAILELLEDDAVLDREAELTLSDEEKKINFVKIHSLWNSRKRQSITSIYELTTDLSMCLVRTKRF